MNAINKAAPRSLKFTWQREISTSLINKRSKAQSELIEEVKRKIEENRKIIRKHSYDHLKARGLNYSNTNLKLVMENVKRKVQDVNALTIANIPSKVSIEVLANGSGHLKPCVVIKTPLKAYMFNCPEGVSRFLPQIRLRALHVTDVFVTRAVWDNIAGISSVLLSKESNALSTRIHGAVNIRSFLECIRPFQDSDYGSEKYPSQVEEYPFTAGVYEDAGLKITYIPLTIPLTEGSSQRGIDIAYFIEMKEPARRIDPMKVISKGVPKGPFIGKLKSGESVTLADGRIVYPEDVFADGEVGINDRKRALIVDCATPAHLKALSDSSIFNELTRSRKVDYVVHFTPQDIVQHPTYTDVFQPLGEQCEHIVVNESGPCVPGIESIYRHQHTLNRICPPVFPSLYPQNWKGLVSQGNELQDKKENYIYAAPLQRFWMRHSGDSDPILLDLRMSETEISDDAEKIISVFHKEIEKLRKPDLYPRISFLGTSSAVPSKYRNVTGYLVEVAADTALMVDVGEGSYGQMKIILGYSGVEEMLLKLRVVLITHAHQDHMNGLHTIIQKRRDVFFQKGKVYEPLILVCNRNVLKPLKTFSFNFEDIESLVNVVDISSYPVTPPPSPGPPNKRRRLPTALTAVQDVLIKMPDGFSKEEWNIQEIKAVQVHHTRMANGFVIGTNGKRIVFSGDTKPCDLLVDEGKEADLLIHEATFEDGHEDNAMKKKHSTMGQAVQIGKKMKAKYMILTHFSARYPKVPALPHYLDVVGNIGIAMDNMQVSFGDLPLLPKLIPIYREVYKEELFEIEIRKNQRDLRTKLEEGTNEKNGN